MPKTQLTLSERGVASLMVTTVLILVIGLIIVGFSQVTRRNQRETLNRQLSTQAFYAAETAVNSVQAYLNTQPIGTIIPEKTTCGPSGVYSESYDLSNTNARVSCLLVNSSASEMYYPTVTDSESTVAPVRASVPISRIELTWRNNDGETDITDCNNNNLPAAGAWTCAHGLLRADIVNTNPSALPNSTVNPAMAAFFRPNTSGSSSVNFSSDPNGSGGVIGASSCSADECSISINGLNSTQYTLRMLSLYKDSAVTIEAYDSSNAQLQLLGQVIVDATGEAGGVLRRIQVRLPVGGQPMSNMPLYGIESNETICKRYVVAPGTPDGHFNATSCPAP